MRSVAVVEDVEECTSWRPRPLWSRRRRLLGACQWRSLDIEDLRTYVRNIEQTLDHPMRRRPEAGSW